MSGRLVLVRHGQSHGNVARRLDTRPPGAALTDLGREQARMFARKWPHDIGLVAHSVAVRATGGIGTAARWGARGTVQGGAVTWSRLATSISQASTH